MKYKTKQRYADRDIHPYLLAQKRTSTVNVTIDKDWLIISFG